MKKFILYTFTVVLAAVITLSSCTDEDKIEKTTLELISQESMDIPPEGGSFEILYRITNPTENGAVKAITENDCEWISGLSCSTYGIISFCVDKNISGNERQITIVVSYEEQSFEVEIIQESSEAAIYDIEFEASMISGFYYGEKYSPGMGDYWFFFTDIGFDSNYASLPNGTYYRIDAYAPLAGNLDNIAVPEGTYKLDMTGSTPSCEAFTFSQAMSMYYSTNENGKMNENDTFSFIDGTLEVKKSDKGYRMDLFLTTSDGLERHIFYEGAVSLEDQSGSGSQDPDLPPTAGEFPAIEQDTQAVFDRSAAVLLGSYSGISEVNVQFANMGTDAEGNWIAPGTALDVHFYTTLNSDFEIAAGSYTCGRGEAGLFRPGGALDIGVWAIYGTYVTSLDENGVKTIGLIESGNIDITKEEDTFTVLFDLTMQGGYKFTGSYTGPIKIDGSTSGALTTLTEDYEVDFTQGEIKATANYWGDFYNTGTGNWTIDISPAPGSSQDDTFITDICCANTGFNDDISGTYTASTNNEAGTFMPGYVSGTNIMGTMYLGGFDANGYVTKLAPAMSGEVTISKNSDGSYTISFDCMDDAANPHNFYGTWTGKLNMVDQSSSAMIPHPHFTSMPSKDEKMPARQVLSAYSYISKHNTTFMYR